MKKRAWIVVLFLIGGLYFLSSIPGLRVLPVISSLVSLFANFDFIFVRLSQWFASQVPLDFRELGHIDTLSQDFLAYARDNPIIIEFFLRKVAHVIVFFFITIALFFLFHQYIKSSRITVFLAFISGSLLGALDEYRQSFVDGRYASTVDVFIDMIGVSLATCLIIFALFLTNTGRKRFYQTNAEETDSLTTETNQNGESPEEDSQEIPDDGLTTETESSEKRGDFHSRSHSTSNKE